MTTNITEGGTRKLPPPARKRAPARRDYTLAYKLEVVNETLVPGASVSIVARQHDINSNVVFRWRKQFREGQLGNGMPVPAFAPVRVVPDVPALPAPQTAKPKAARDATKPASFAKPGVMAITLPGGFTLRVDADIDDAALRRVLRAVKDLA